MVVSEMLTVNLRYDGSKNGSESEGFFTGGVGRKSEGAITELSVNVRLVQLPHVYARVLNVQESIFADIVITGDIQGVLSRRQFNPFWSEPSFEKDLRALPDNIQNMLLHIDNTYIAVLPVVCGNFNTTITRSGDKNTLRFCLSACYDGAVELHGIFAVMAAAQDPYEAVKNAYQYACDKGLIQTRLREQKSLAPMYRGIGWCTWDAFYREVCEMDIFRKLDEFKEKGVPVRWVMIDDGWMQVSNKEQFALLSFREDRKKFPNGLKACVERMKCEYGVEQVGVWHALTGYWFGVEKDGELFEAQRENLEETNSGLFVPDGEKAYDFFCRWYAYLQEQGIDFVKIDGQGNVLEFLRGKKDCISRCRALQVAVDRAVRDCFDGNVINCMGMNNVNAQNRPYTALSRNSDDFLPRKPKSFQSHLLQNAYNAVFHSDLFWCDYDMFQSYDSTAKISAILRAISGGPVYLSDAVGKTDYTYIAPFLGNDGELILCDDCARPAKEHLFENPKDGVLKLINRKGNGYVMAVFNLSDKPQTVSVCPDVLNDNFVARCFFEKKFYFALPFRLELAAFDAELINFYPLKDGVFAAGDFSKYISAGGRNRYLVDTL